MKTSWLGLIALGTLPLGLAHAQTTVVKPPVAAPATIAPSTAAPATPNPNLALHKTYVSSDPNKSGWDVGLTDGSWRPVRPNTYATGNTATFPKTVTIDLETPTRVGYVALGVPPFGSTKTVSVSLSTDNVTFQEVGTYAFAQNTAENHLFTFAPAAARYVRLTYSDHHEATVQYPATHGFTTEVGVYAPGAPPVLPPALIGPEPADVASPKLGDVGLINATFQRSHEAFLKRGKEGPIGVLFLGDSITARWQRNKDIWEQHYGAYQPANFGIGGDRTQHVLWRIENGELDGIRPKIVVLLIGTNNISYPAADIIKADQKIVAEIHRRLPQTKLLLLGIFPRGAEATNPARAKIKAVNKELAKLNDGNRTRYLDIGDKFLDANGAITPTIMADALHPTAQGYQIWADAMQPLLDEMMKQGD